MGQILIELRCLSDNACLARKKNGEEEESGGGGGAG